jgi:hypothetical protein
VIGALLGLLLSAGAPPADVPPDPSAASTAARPGERSRPEPDPELLRDLDLLQDLELLQHLDLFE